MTFQLQIDKGSQIESRVAIATGFLGQSRSDNTLAHGGRTQAEMVVSDESFRCDSCQHYYFSASSPRSLSVTDGTGRKGTLRR